MIPYFFLMHPSISVFVKWCSCCIWDQLIGQTRQMSGTIYLTLLSLHSLLDCSRLVYYFCLHKDNQISFPQKNQCCRSTLAWHWSRKSQAKLMGKKELCLKLDAFSRKWGRKMNHKILWWLEREEQCEGRWGEHFVYWCISFIRSGLWLKVQKGQRCCRQGA